MNYRAEIHEVLSNQKSLNTFAIGGEIKSGINPLVSIDGVGLIGFPVANELLQRLISAMEQAPFGLGLDTVIDLNVRRAWQIDGSKMNIGKLWRSEVLSPIVSEVCVALGVKSKVEAKLYKLLCYEEGGHFKKHRDTEKEAGMFGSLIISLISDFEGGALVVQHGGESKRFDYSGEVGLTSNHYSAFYADCEHYLEPVTRGTRIVLAYNLVLSDATEYSHELSAASAMIEKARLMGCIDAWTRDPVSPITRIESGI